MVSGAERRLSLRARELKARGREALATLPDHAHLAEQPEGDRHQVLEGLRLELYAISSIIADATVQRARGGRQAYPPYGLVRSMHSESRMLISDPEPVQEGAIDGFHALGKAYVDTMVFHLDRQFKDPADADQGWMTQRLEELLALFRIGAGPLARSRLRDALSFIYGGLHFGTGVSVQLAEVMARLLGAFPDMTTDDKAQVMNRSIRPAYRLAAMNIDHVVIAYQRLQGPPQHGTTWMKPEAFNVQQSDDRPWRIDLRGAEELLSGRLAPTTYETQGCPARISPGGGPSPIATLWAWCVELALAVGLLASEVDTPRGVTAREEGPSGPSPSA